LSNSDKIWYVGAESHTDDDKKLKIETGSRISTWRSFCLKAEVVVSQVWIAIEKPQIEKLTFYDNV